MNEIIDKIYRYIEQNNMLTDCERVVVGLSGGADSVALLRVLTALGYPVLLATSRKSVIGLTLDLPTDERVEGTMVTTVYGVQQHAAFVRVHDVKENMRAIRMTQAIMRAV